MQEVYDFLKKCGVYYLATVEGDQPRVRPFGTVDIWQGKLCIQTGKRKECSRQLHDNPKAEICAFLDGKWLRLSGTLKEVPDREAKKQMLDAYPELRSMYNEDDGNTEIFAFEDATAVIASFTEAPKIIRL